MKRKLLALLGVVALILSGCNYSPAITMPETLEEGLNDRTSDIVGIWYYKSEDYNGLIYLFDNDTGEFLLLEYDDAKSDLINFEYKYNPDTGLFTMKRSKLEIGSMTFSISDDKSTITCTTADGEVEYLQRVE